MSDNKEDFKQEVLLPDKQKQTQGKKRRAARVEEVENDEHADILNALQAPSVYREVVQAVKPRPEFHIRASYPGQFVQFDLLDVHQLAPLNDGVTFLANFVDVFSRYAWSFPLKKKSDLPGKMEDILEKILDTNIRNAVRVRRERMKLGRQLEGQPTPFPENIYSDGEAVANKKEFKALLEKEHINWVTIPPGDKTPLAMVERFNYTLRDLMAKYMFNTNSNKYINALPGLLSVYNRTEKSSMGRKTPVSIFVRGAKFKDTRQDLPPKFKIGDFVRTRREVGLFDKKSWAQKWSLEVYQIVGNEGPYRFTLQQVDADEPEEEGYKPEQLKKINYNPETHREEQMPVEMLEERENLRAKDKTKRKLRREGI
jgi:transposase InsO family protein